MIDPDFLLNAERVVWSGLAALALLFASIAIRLREDRESALLGSGLSLLCLVVAPDVWVPRSAGRMLPGAWIAALQDGEQIAACVYCWVSLRFAQSLIGRPGPSAMRIHTGLLSAFGVGFYLDALSPAAVFIGAGGGEYFATPAYAWLFAPYLISLFAWIVWLTVRGWRQSRGETRRTLGALSIAYGLLLAGGSIDFIAMLFPGIVLVSSATTIAALSMGAIAIYLFTARLIRLYAGQREALLKLAAIREDMELNRPLGQLGQSAAHITESIRGFVDELKSDAESLRSHPVVGGRSEVARIESARRHLETFTTGILAYSRIARPGERRLLAPSSLAAECIAALSPPERARVQVSGSARSPIAGDPAQLRRALGELVRNALQAGAANVRIRLAEGLGRVSLAVEDDGPGVPMDRLDRVAEPFFTSRKAEGACGLGASISQAIFRTHGGSLAFYPAPSPSRSGLLANAILPAARVKETERGNGTGWILVSDEAARIERFLAACANAGIFPVVRGSARTGSAAEPSNGIAIVDAAAGPVAELPARWKRFRLAGDAAKGDYDGGAAWLREESLLALAAPGTDGG
jgi:signal transduction histidine kinase